MRNIKSFVVIKEKLNGQLPEEVDVREFYQEKTAKTYFYDVCDDLCYPWQNIIQSNSDYLLIAEAGGIGCDYRIMLAAYYE